MKSFSVEPDKQENESSFVTIQVCSNKGLYPFGREDKTEIMKKKLELYKLRTILCLLSNE